MIRDPFAEAAGLYKDNAPPLKAITRLASPELEQARLMILSPTADALPDTHKAALARTALAELNFGVPDDTGKRFFGEEADDSRNFERVREFLLTGARGGELATFLQASPEDQDKMAAAGYTEAFGEGVAKGGPMSAPSYDALTPEQKAKERAAHVQRLAEKDRGLQIAQIEKLLSLQGIAYGREKFETGKGSRLFFERNLTDTDRELMGTYVRLLQGQTDESLATTAGRSTVEFLASAGRGAQAMFQPAITEGVAGARRITGGDTLLGYSPVDGLVFNDAEAERRFMESERPDVPQTTSRQIAASIGPSLGTMANPFAGIASLVNERFESLHYDQGVPEGKAAAVAGTMGTVEALLEYVQAKGAAGAFRGLWDAWRGTAGKTALQRLNTVAAAGASKYAPEVAENWAQELAQDTLAALQPVVAGVEDKTARKQLAEVWNVPNLVETLKVTGALVLLFGGPAEAARVLGPDRRAITIKDQHEAATSVAEFREVEREAAASDLATLRQIVEAEADPAAQETAIKAAGYKNRAEFDEAVGEAETLAAEVAPLAEEGIAAIADAATELAGGRQTDRADSAEVTRPPVPPAGEATGKDSLQVEAQRVAEALGVEVRVARTVEDVPEPVRNAYKTRTGNDLTDANLAGIGGFFDDGIAYVTPSATQLSGGIPGAVIHEAIGHGLEREILDDPGFAEWLDAPRVERILTRYGVNNSYQGERIRAAEVVARTAQDIIRIADGESGVELTEDQRTLWRRILDWLASKIPSLRSRVSDAGVQRYIAEALVAAQGARNVSRETSGARFAVSQSERAASIALARQIMDTNAPVTAEDVRKLLPDADDTKAEEIVARAEDMARGARLFQEEVASELAAKGFEGKRSILKAEDRARRIAERVYKEGRSRGIVEAKAKATLAARSKAERAAELAGIEAMPIGDMPVDVSLEDLKAATVAEGQRRGYKEDSPEWRVLYRKALADMLDRRARELVPSTAREQIVIAIRDLGGPGSRLETTEKKAAAIAERIERARVREDRGALLSAINKMVSKSGKRVSTTDEIETRKIDPEVQRWVSEFVKPALKMTAEKADARIEEIDELLASGEAPEGRDWLSWSEDLTDEREALAMFGGLKDEGRDITEIQDAHDTLESEISGGRAKILALREQRKQRQEKDRAIILKALALGRGKSTAWVRDNINGSIVKPYTLRDMLKDLARFAPDNSQERAEILGLVDRINERIADSTYQADFEERRISEEFRTALERIYGDAGKAAQELTRERKEFAKFSRIGDPRTLEQLIQEFATFEMEEYRKQAVSGTNKKLEERYANFAAIRKQLSAKDLALLDWMRERYWDALPELSAVSERTTGVKVRSSGLKYVPAKMAAPGKVLPEVHITLTTIPKFLSRRVSHNRDLDEKAGVLSMFAARAKQTAHYKAFAELGIDLRGLLNHPEVAQALEDVAGREFAQRLGEHVLDVLTDGAVRSLTGDSKAFSWLFGYAAVTNLAWNAKSALKQTVGVSALANEIGWLGILAENKTVKGGLVGTFGSWAMSPGEQWDALGEIVKSDNFKSRFGAGNSVAIAQIADRWAMKAKNAYIRNGLMVLQAGDMVGLMVTAPYIYRAYLNSPKAKGMRPAEAKQYALNRTFEIYDSNIQSRFRKDASYYVRRGGAFASAVVGFKSPAAIAFSKEIRAFREFLAAPSAARMARFIGVVGTNHIGALAFFGTGLLLNAWIRDDEVDDQDFAQMLAALMVGQAEGFGFSGAIAAAITETLATGDPRRATLDIPAGKVAKDVVDFSLLVAALFSQDEDEALKQGDKVLDALNPLYRDVSKAVEARE